MNHQQNDEVLEENKKLKKELRKFRFWASVFRYVTFGPGVVISTARLISKYKDEPKAIHEDEIARFIGSVIGRISLGIVFAAILTAIPSILVYWQFREMRNQNELLRFQSDMQVQYQKKRRLEISYYSYLPATNNQTPIDSTLKVVFVNNTEEVANLTETKFHFQRFGSFGVALSGINFESKYLVKFPEKLEGTVELTSLHVIESGDSEAIEYNFVIPKINGGTGRIIVTPEFCFNAKAIYGNPIEIAIGVASGELIEGFHSELSVEERKSAIESIFVGGNEGKDK